MLNMRWRKTLRDLWQQRGRATLVVVAMTLGVFGVVWVSASSVVLSRELRAQYLATNPASATFVATGLTPEVAAATRAMPGVAAVETATTLTARVRVGPSDYIPMRLFARTDFTANSIARLVPQEGVWPPPPGEVIIERAAMRVAKTGLGDTIELDVPGGRSRTLRVAGTVHDLGQAPAWQDGLVYGYVTPGTLARLGMSPDPTELRILVDGDRLDRSHINSVATTVAGRLRAAGVRVTQVFVPIPGVHPHQSQMDSLLWLQQSFGVLALGLSGLLVATLMAALLAGQVRQIGAMKAVGARTGQIPGSYAGMVGVLAAVSLLIGWPLGWLAARGYIVAVAAILNFDAGQTGLPGWLVIGQLAGAVAVPLLAAAVPVIRAARATPAAAMRDHGVTAPAVANPTGLRARLAAWLSRRPLPRLPLMAARNAFRRRGRVAVTLTALALGGATFMAALNLSTSLNSTMDGQAEALHYDVAVNLDHPYPADRVAAAARGVSGVSLAETWLRTPVTVGAAETAALAPTLYGVPVDTPMLRMPVLSGRWLRPGDSRAIVVSHNLASAFPGVVAGTDVQLRVNGQLGSWHVVGVVRQVAAPPAAWVSYDDLASTLGAAGTTNAVRVLADSRDPDALTGTRRALDDALTSAGIGLTSNQNTVEAQQVRRDHVLVIVTFLGLMTLLSILIGGLGLATTMAINVIERTREIGILRAVGAATRTLLALVALEGGIVGALSWLLSLALSIPASILFGNIMGQIMLEAPLDFTVNGWGPLVWLAVVIVFSGLASLTPARRAAALTVRDTLAYQ
ncbi:MAG: FtsX-like permease family protein [Actinobacteria bacterium]|nr:FtsX-like permease family protein [Actinomycetota bacterium]